MPNLQKHLPAGGEHFGAVLVLRNVVARILLVGRPEG